jgi:hypothetical protein
MSITLLVPFERAVEKRSNAQFIYYKKSASTPFERPKPKGFRHQVGAGQLQDEATIRVRWLNAEVWNIAQSVVEAVGEIGGADHQRQLHDLPFVVELPQFF